MTAEVALQRNKNTEQIGSPDGRSAALDAPFTRPFEGFTYIKKDWVDHEDGITSVTLNMALGQLNLPADWANTETYMMMPEWGTVPLRRSWVVRLPTWFKGHEKYLFHYYFQIAYEDATEKVSDTFTQLVVPRMVEYIDHSGECTHIVLHWSVDGWSYPQNTELEVEGVEWGHEFSVSQVPYRSKDPLYEKGRLLYLRKMPPPRRFYAVIWAPRGAHLNYCFNLVSTDNQGKLFNRWDNNCGKDFTLTI
jgi:hypothetical protein